jgi:hypothetical protein
MTTNHERCYILTSTVEKDFETDEPLSWNNELGWVERASATRFDAHEAATAMLIGPFRIETVKEN